MNFILGLKYFFYCLKSLIKLKKIDPYSLVLVILIYIYIGRTNQNKKEKKKNFILLGT